MKRIIACLLAMALALGMFPASHTHAAETEETVAEETLVAEIPEPAEETAQAETSLPRTVAAAPKTELEKSIEKQIRAFAKSVNKPNADDDAAWEIAQHGMFKGGKKLSVGKNHVLTATLMNSELVQTALTAYCASAFQSMEHLGLDQLNAHGSLKWEGAAGAVKYQVYYATSKYGKYKLLKTTEDLTYTYTSAKKGKTYYFKVRAVDQNGTTGDYSTVKSIKSK